MEPQTGNRPRSISDAAFDIVALAASAGGLTALSRVLAALPDGFPATLVVVQHLDPRHRSLMADILSRRTPLRVKQAEEGEQVGSGNGLYCSPEPAPAGEPRWYAVAHPVEVGAFSASIRRPVV